MRGLFVGSAILALALGSGQPTHAQGADSSWDRTIRPLVARTCSECHARDGEAGIDLMSAAAWKRRRADLRRVVVVDRTMPPSGRSLSDADRESIRGWLEGER